MRNSKVVKFYNSLSLQELKAFGKMVRSPFFNTNASIVALHDTLKVQMPRILEDKVTKENLFKKIFKNQPFNDARLRNLMLEMNQLLKVFFIQQELQENESQKGVLLLEALAKRRLEKAFVKNFQDQLQRFELTENQTPREYLDHYFLLEKYYHHPQTNRYQLDADYMAKTIRCLNQFFVLSKLQLGIEITSRNKLLAEAKTHFFFLPHFPEYIASLEAKDQPLMKIYYGIIDFYQNPDSEILQSSIHLFKTQRGRISPFDQKFLLTTFINQLNILLVAGDTDYLKNIFALYRFGIEKNILTFENTLTVFSFLNIVAVASRLKKFSWVRDFIQSHAELLPADEKEQTELLAKATLEYDQGNYGTAEKLLRYHSFRNSPLGLRFRFILSKVHIEMAFQQQDYLPVALSFFTNSLQYLRKVSGTQTNKIKALTNFLSIGKTILKQLEHPEEPIIRKIKTEVLTLQPLSGKEWLLQKISQLEQTLPL